MTTQLDRDLDLAAVEEFYGKVAVDQAAAYNAVLAYLGDRLGLWSALASVGAVTSAELAERTGLAERYLREWLAAQAAAGYVTYDAATLSFALSPEAAMVLADEGSPAFAAATYEVIAAVWAATDKLANAYATGEGVAWHDHDPRLYTGVDRFYSVAYRSSLVAEWLPAIDGLVERLEAGIRVADIGCGLGYGDDPDGRGLPALDLRRGGLPRGVDPARPRGRPGRRRGRPGAIRGGRRVGVRR